LNHKEKQTPGFTVLKLLLRRDKQTKTRFQNEKERKTIVSSSEKEQHITSITSSESREVSEQISQVEAEVEVQAEVEAYHHPAGRGSVQGLGVQVK